MSGTPEGITGFHSVLLSVPVEQLDHVRAAYTRLLGTQGTHPQLTLAPKGTHGLIFTTDSEQGTTRLLARRGLQLTRDDLFAVGVSEGLAYAVTEDRPVRSAENNALTVDHVVVLSANRDRIIATLSGRLGLDLRLDRVQPWGVHQLFFRCPELVLEVALRGDEPSAPDSLWGIAWHTPDIEATRARLSALGVPVGEIRDGRKPGTQVATVKDDALRVPTILIGQQRSK